MTKLKNVFEEYSLLASVSILLPSTPLASASEMKMRMRYTFINAHFSLETTRLGDLVHVRVVGSRQASFHESWGYTCTTPQSGWAKSKLRSPLQYCY